MTYDEFIQNILNTRGRFSVPESEYKERHHMVALFGGIVKKVNKCKEL